MGELLKNRKFQIIAAVVVVLIFALLALVIFNGSGPVEDESTPVSVSLVWWNVHNNPIYEQVAAEFSQSYGGAVSIQVVNIPYNNGETYYRDLVMEFARKTAPDIFSLRNDDIPAWREFITPLVDIPGFTNRQIIDQYRENFVPLVYKDTTFRDEVYAVTTYMDNLQMYYNQEILNQAGIPLRPKTWREFEEQARIINQRNSDNVSFEQSTIALGTGLTVENGDIIRDTNVANFYDIIPTLIFQNGNPIYDTLTEKSVLGAGRNQQDANTTNITRDSFDNVSEDDPVFSALRYFTSFTDRDSPRYSWTIDSPDSKEAFLQGKLAYSINYRGFEAEIKEKNPRLKYGITELPQLDLNFKKTNGKFFADVINRDLETKGLQENASLEDFYKYEYAKRFLYYLMQPEVQTKILGATNLPAARYDLIKEQQQGDVNLGLFANGNLYADSYYKPNVAKVEQMWGRLLYKYHYENIPLKEGMGEMVQEYNVMVQRGPEIRF